MSLTVALNTAVSGLFANQRAIAATSENIANVNTPDFVRRESNFFTDAIPGQFAGVQVEIARAGINRFLQSAGFSSGADASRSSVVADAIARVEASLGAPAENLSFANKLDDAFAAFAELSAAPSSVAAKAVAVAELDAAFDAFARTLSAIDEEALATGERLDAQIARANVLLEEIFNLNQIVAESNGAGDEIDARLRELSSLIDINVTRDDDGRVSVSTTNGTFLTNAGGFTPLSAGAVATAATSGEIGGLLALQSTELPALRTIVETAAREIATEINAVYAGNANVGAGAPPAATPLIVETGGAFSVNRTILDDPTQLAVARPASGVGGANDGSGAAAIAALANGTAARDVATAVTQIGAASRIATDASASAEAFASEISSRLQSEGGVNLDEELSNLILFQRAYGANARVIAAVDELYQSLLSIL